MQSVVPLSWVGLRSLFGSSFIGWAGEYVWFSTPLLVHFNVLISPVQQQILNKSLEKPDPQEGQCTPYNSILTLSIKYSQTIKPKINPIAIFHCEYVRTYNYVKYPRSLQHSL